MLKRDYKARVATNQFDLNTLPICGVRTRSGGLCKHKGNIQTPRWSLYRANEPDLWEESS